MKFTVIEEPSSITKDDWDRLGNYQSNTRGILTITNKLEYVHCPTCRSIHYPGEPCAYCFHKEKDARDIERYQEQQEWLKRQEGK